MLVPKLFHRLQVNVAVLVENPVHRGFVGLAELNIFFAQVRVLVEGVRLVPQVAQHHLENRVFFYLVALGGLAMLFAEL